MNRRRLLLVIVLLGGILLAGDALLDLGRTAYFVHESELVPGVVTDERERPFEGWGEMIAHGNFPWENNTAHCPIVRFSIDGHVPTADRLPDLDAHAYPNGEQVELFYHRPTGAARINRFHLLWGGDLTRFAGGCILALLARNLLRRRKCRCNNPAAAPTAARRAVEPAQPAPPKRRRNSPGKKTARAASGSKRRGRPKKSSQ